MKKLFTLLVVFTTLLSANRSFAQNPHPFELGFNIGAAWQKSDVKMKKLGEGYGFTFGQTYCMNKTSPVLWGWRFRYLNSNTYGQDNVRSYGLANNNVFNGTNDTLLDYKNNLGYVYQNYKTNFNEVGLEMLLGLNRIRERTNFYPYIFGGAGLTKAVVKIDQLDKNNQRYDYASIDSNGTASSGVISGRLNSMYDGTYETSGDGGSPRWRLMPYLGVGLGYEIVKGFSIGLEHKVTWTFTDITDGAQWTNTNMKTGTNDVYHYTSFWLKFSFGRGAGHSNSTSTTTESTYNSNSTNTNTNTNSNSNSNSNNTTTISTNTNTNSNTNTNTTTIPAPTVTFTSPSSSPFTTTQNNYIVTANVTHVNSISDLSLSVNGNSASGFTYNSSTQVFSYSSTLIQGANVFTLTATNQSGTGTATTTIISHAEVVNTPAPPPIVTITSPAANPFNTTFGTANLTATILHVINTSEINVTVNGSPTNAFAYNMATHILTMSISLINGANVISIGATNAVGSDSKTETIIYSQPVGTTPPPAITITNPVSNPFNTTISSSMINATILNVTALGQISVSVNGGGLPTAALSWNPAGHQLNFTAHLVVGANMIQVSATNVSGSDSKTETIIYSEPVAATPPPVVTITNPVSNPYNSSTNSTAVTATVLNVTALGQISVSINGATLPTLALSWTAASHQLHFNANLIAGANTVQVSATNVSGSDSKNTIIIYKEPVVVTPKPVVIITNPSVNPFNTSVNSAPVTANVLNVTSIGQIAVSVNGGGLPTAALSFDPGTHVLNFTANLMEGSNTVQVSATNVSGSDSKTETIIYTAPVLLSKPMVTITDPSVNPFNVNSEISSYMVHATVVNVESSAQISVIFNGVLMSPGSWSYNISSKQLMVNLNLILGSNSLKITAANSAGSSFKMQTINRNAPVLTPTNTIDTIHRPGKPVIRPGSTTPGSTTPGTTTPMGHRGGH